MSIPKKMTVKCSKCGAEIDVTVFESVNTDFAEDITEQITSGDLFNAKCDKCGFVSHLEYDVLYHDVKHGAMIWVLHNNSPEYSDRVAELRSSANILGYKTTRIVNNMNELRQKVACLENGRDDRIIELCKVFIAYNLLSKQPDFDFNNAFYTTFLGKERVFLYDKNGQELSCELTDDTYSLLCEMYYNSEYASAFEDYYALVDYNWAESVLQPLLKREAERIDAKNSAKSAVTNSATPSEKKVICPKCKQDLPKDSLFCHFCGTNLEDTTLSSEKSNPQETSTASAPMIHTLNHSAKVKKSKKKPIIITVIICLAIALAIGIAAFLQSNSDDLGSNDGKQSTTQTDDGRPTTVNNVAVRTISLSDKFTAEYVLATWKNGKATEQTMIEIMNEYGAAQGGGKLYVIERGEFIEEIDEWCFSSNRKVGDYAIIENAYGYTICYISGFNKDDDDSLADWNNNAPSYEDIGVTFAQYTLAGMISDDPLTYCEYIVELDKTLSKGSYGIDLQKEKATEYVNNLSLDYGQRIILFKIQFPSDTTYCSDIVDYINERDDISYDDAVFILEELGFAVFDDGTVKW